MTVQPKVAPAAHTAPGRPATSRPRPAVMAGATGATGSPRRYGQWAASVLFVVVVSLAAGWLYVTKGDTTEALVVARPVAAGEVITTGDLDSAQITGVSGAISVAELDQVLGQRAVAGLVAGQVLTSTAVTTEPVPGPGEQMVAIRLDAGRVPVALEAGAVLDVLVVPAVGESGDAASLGSPLVIAERVDVYAVQPGLDGSVVVSLLIPAGEADPVAAYGAAGRVTVALASLADRGEGPAPATGSGDRASDGTSDGASDVGGEGTAGDTTTGPSETSSSATPDTTTGTSPGVVPGDTGGGE